MAVDVLGTLIAKLHELQAHAESRRRAGQQRGSRSPRPDPSAALRELRNGEVTLRGYLRRKVDETVQPLIELIEDDDVRFIRALLWERIETDPALTPLIDRLARTQNADAEVGAHGEAVPRVE